MRLRALSDVVFTALAVSFALVVLKYVYCRYEAKWAHDEARQRIFEIYRLEHPEKGRKVTETDRTAKKGRIAVNVMVCDNTAQLRALLSNVTRWTTSERFGVLVSLGCDNEEARDIAEQFNNEVVVLEPEWRRAMERRDNPQALHPPIIRAQPTVRLFNATNKQRQALLRNGGSEEYKRVSNQYKHSLTYSFDVFGYDYALFIEEGSLLSEDFFEFARSGADLLSKNPNLFCVSAWNENGESLSHHKSKLHRTHLFRGVGWLIASATWSEVIDEWPAVFWDQWMGERMREQGRHCVKPDLSRIYFI